MPTMEMVRSQFHLPTPAPAIQLGHCDSAGYLDSAPASSSHGSLEVGPDLRQLAEERLAEEKANQLNQLGTRIQERWKSFQELLGSQVRGALVSEENDSL